MLEMRVDALSLLANGAAERAFANEIFLRRVAKLAHLDPDARVLQVAVGDGSIGLLMAQSFRCQVLVADEDPNVIELLSQQAHSLALGARLTTVRGTLKDVDSAAGPFAAIFATGALSMPFRESAEQLRPLLDKDGRFCRIYPVRVGIGAVDEGLAKAWRELLGEPLPTPTELLQGLEHAGFEPEVVEVLSDTDLDAVFRATPPSPEEMKLYEAVTARPRATYAVAVGRRKEPGEKPPASGDRG